MIIYASDNIFARKESFEAEKKIKEAKTKMLKNVDLIEMDVKEVTQLKT